MGRDDFGRGIFGILEAVLALDHIIFVLSRNYTWKKGAASIAEEKTANGDHRSGVGVKLSRMRIVV